MAEKKTEVLEGMKDVVAQGYTSAGNALHRIAGTEKGKQLDKEIKDKQDRGIDMVKMYDAMDRREAGKNAAENMKRYGMKKGGSVKSASSRADGIAQRGKTRGMMK